MFTFCTRTAYIGADFYSTNAKTYIFSDANIDCLMVDVTLDLPQIMGRQRLDINPWKNCADLYFKLSGTELTQDIFDKRLEVKMRRSNEILSLHSKGNVSEQITYSNQIETIIEYKNYADDYVAVNRHVGLNPLPVFLHKIRVGFHPLLI